ncbi:XkdF-like putative serine protease domain-containing protein [Methanosphaera sp.]|uniref:XkdF-like putative serine protease domain-containing protein n=1 Tax=Methanosphaera sp. TaxID=2666342 RepID=UPI0025D42665|nr:XkdF-like putative serine protease domain-containing protein [Methanosphaera sp.]
MTEEDTIYVKCCVLANSLKDTEDDLLLREDIKKIFTNTKNINYDIEHGNKYLDGVREHERYINQSDEYINDTLIPAGSWLQVLAITNKTLQEQLINNEISGVSLRTELGENVVLYDTTSGRIPYNNIKNKESMQPSSISFTDHPANQLPMEVMNYNEYTAKTQTRKNRKNDNMTDQHQNNESEVSFWRKLFTAKNTATAPVPQANDIFGTGANADEFMQSMIEANKSIPRQNELLEKLLESQTKSNEAIAKLGGDVEKLQLDISEMQMQKPQKKPNGQDGEGDPDPTQKGQHFEPPKDPQPPQDPQDPKDPEAPQDPDDPEPPEGNPQHTAKTSKPLRLNNNYQDQYEEEAMKFIANRSYENLIKNR